MLTELGTGLVHFVEVIIMTLAGFVHGTINQLGYVGVALLMAIESANIPLPSELILPYAGYLVQQGKMNLHLAALSGAVGCVLGSVPMYALGAWGGRRFLERYGKWLLLTTEDLDKAARWSLRYGDTAFFVCRMLPIVRTFISLPAGILNVNYWPFVGLTFLGSLLWSYALVYAGIVFGKNLDAFKHVWHQFDVAIALLVLLLGCWYVWSHTKAWRKGAWRKKSDAASSKG
jgi:membrane protein DedA with SNARE-associated domain